MILKTLLVSATIVLSTQAMASGVASCATDSFAKEQIEENVPVAERIDVLNAAKEVVGAFHYAPQTGEAAALYLCGPNSGYYYTSGNILTGNLGDIYNDEYSSEFEIDGDGPEFNLKLHKVYFEGDEESADYAPFSADLFFTVPVK